MLQALARWKATILIISAVLMLGLFLSRHLVGPLAGGRSTVGPVAADSAAVYVGQRADVCGSVAEVTQVSSLDGRPTFINLGGLHPDQAFTALIWEEDRAQWGAPPEAQYAGRTICITGTVQRHQGTPQIIVSAPGQIRIEGSRSER